MKKSVISFQLFIFYLTFAISISACDQNRSKAKIGNTRDTGSVNKGGGPPIRDTATINQDRKDSASHPAGDTKGKGNADPSGRIKSSKPKA